MDSQELDLVVAALQFAQNGQQLFIHWLVHEGHGDLALYAATNLDKLRIKMSDEHHHQLDAEWGDD